MRIHFAPLFDRPDAIPVVARWWCDEWGLPRRHETLDAYMNELAGTEPGRLPVHLLALREDGVVGVATLKDRSDLQVMFPGFQYWLSGVYVPLPLRGKGIATALSLQIVDIARTRGVSRLYLQTEALDGGLYAKLGWKPLERVRLGGPEQLVMVIDVRSAKGAA
jgi:GNAT superfamily N-acetyltransferase